MSSILAKAGFGLASFFFVPAADFDFAGEAVSCAKQSVVEKSRIVAARILMFMFVGPGPCIKFIIGVYFKLISRSTPHAETI